MSQSDWSVMAGSADGVTFGGTTILRNTTNGITGPAGDLATSVFAFNSIESVDAAVGVYTSLSGFSPLTSGVQLTGCIQRGISGSQQGWSNFFFLCSTGSNVADRAYMFGIEDSTPGRLVLAKGPINVGLTTDSSAVEIIRTSKATYNWGTWIHLKIEAIVQPSGDVVFKMYTNDLDANDLSNPSAWNWVALEFEDKWSDVYSAGEFIDDVTGVNTGSTTLTSGYVGYAYKCTNTPAARGYFDYISLASQS